MSEIKPNLSNSSNELDTPVMALMREAGVEMTRENYLNLCYFGEVPDEIGPELEAEMPEQFRLDHQPEGGIEFVDFEVEGDEG